jgi:hypothetical protein
VLPVHGVGELTIADSEHPNLGAQYVNAGGFTFAARHRTNFALLRKNELSP